MASARRERIGDSSELAAPMAACDEEWWRCLPLAPCMRPWLATRAAERAGTRRAGRGVGEGSPRWARWAVTRVAAPDRAWCAAAFAWLG